MPILPRSARQSWAASSFKIREIYSMGSERNHFAIVCSFLLFRSDDLSFGLVRSFYQDRQQVSFAFQNSGKESIKILVINLTDNSFFDKTRRVSMVRYVLALGWRIWILRLNLRVWRCSVHCIPQKIDSETDSVANAGSSCRVEPTSVLVQSIEYYRVLSAYPKGSYRTRP